jgi:hypothetical protein
LEHQGRTQPPADATPLPIVDHLDRDLSRLAIGAPYVVGRAYWLGVCAGERDNARVPPAVHLGDDGAVTLRQYGLRT